MSTNNKQHHFELVMRSFSNDDLNQEVVLVREYANTPAELTAKQMGFTKASGPALIAAVIDGMDQLSAPLQEVGMQEMLDNFAEMQKTQGKGRGKK